MLSAKATRRAIEEPLEEAQSIKRLRLIDARSLLLPFLEASESSSPIRLYHATPLHGFPTEANTLATDLQNILRQASTIPLDVQVQRGHTQVHTRDTLGLVCVTLTQRPHTSNSMSVDAEDSSEDEDPTDPQHYHLLMLQPATHTTSTTQEATRQPHYPLLAFSGNMPLHLIDTLCSHYQRAYDCLVRPCMLPPLDLQRLALPLFSRHQGASPAPARSGTSHGCS